MINWLRSYELHFARLIFIAVAVAYFVRNFFGVSVGDEALLVTIADFPRIGARWFVDEMTVQTTGSILLSPFVTVYTSLFGTTGVFLFSRIVYWLVAVGASWLMGAFLSRFWPRPVSLLFGALTIAFVPHGMSCLSYNSLGMLFYGLGTALTLAAVREARPKLALWGGFSWVVAVFAYPTALLTFFLFCATLVVPWIRMRERRRIFARFALGLLIPSAILVAVLLRAGVENIAQTVELSRQFNMPFNPIKFPDAWSVYKAYWPPVWLTLSLIALWVLLAFVKPSWTVVIYPTLLCAYIFLGGKGEQSYLQALWPIAQVMVAPGLVLAWRTLDGDQRGLVVHFFIPAVFGSLVAAATSRLTVYNMAGTAIFATMIGGLIVGRKNNMATWVTGLILLTFTVVSQWHRPYEDDPIAKLNFQMPSGPFKYLWTHKLKGQGILAVEDELKLLPSTGTVFFQDHFPAGFLMTELKPLGPTINMLPAFLHPEARPIFANLFSNTKYWPDYVIDFRGFPISTNNSYFYRDSLEENPTSAKMKEDPFYNFFVRAAGYKIIKDRSLFRVLKRP